MNMRMPRGGLTPVVGADRSWDFSLECLQFWSRVMSDSPSTGICGELWRSTFRQPQHANPGAGGYEMRCERSLDGEGRILDRGVSLRLTGIHSNLPNLK
ncbi:hypothetical protein BgiBS90_010561 [Biomphalaria glabrata]|nr:hypothetical protein BgiBS90_010561 [Biomphalaria glabrata]